RAMVHEGVAARRTAIFENCKADTVAAGGIESRRRAGREMICDVHARARSNECGARDDAAPSIGANDLRRRPRCAKPPLDLRTERDQAPFLLPTPQCRVGRCRVATVVANLLAEEAGAYQNLFH